MVGESFFALLKRPSTAHMSDTRTAHASDFRPDIQGLRAIALALVLAFHAGLGLDGGYVGVDVFFVLSGFLITGLLIREGEKTGRISFLSFYAKRAKRLFPAAALVLVATTIATALWGPSGELTEFGLDAVFAAAYLVNWRFAERSVDYLAEDVGRSPFLHFWSLSVEEQFYFIWPALIAIGLLVSTRFKRPLKLTLGVVLLTVFAPSLIHSALEDTDPKSFFVTTTRLWELALGAYVALGRTTLSRIPARFGAAISAVGLAMILSAAVLYNAKTPWPSVYALLPTVGAALTLIGGQANSASTIAKALALPPAQFLGAISYSAYLWHWPFIVVGQDWLELKGPAWGFALCALSIIPATLSYRLVEQPVRFAKALAAHPPYTLAIGASLSLSAVVAGLTLTLSGTSSPGHAQAEPVSVSVRGAKIMVLPENAGALALGKHPTRAPAGEPQRAYPPFLPLPANARRDVPSSYGRRCQTKDGSSKITWCKYGDTQSSRRFVLAGDSLILQYADAFDAIGRARGWLIETATKSSCPFSVDPEHREDCKQFNQNVLAALRERPPEVVFTNQHGTSTPEYLLPYWTELTQLGIKVVAIGANPRPPPEQSVYQCLLKNKTDYTKCAFSRQEGLERSALSAQKAAAAKLTGAHVIDLTDYICPKKRCAPVIGNVLVFRQGSHITNSYAKSLAPIIAEKLDKLGL